MFPRWHPAWRYLGGSALLLAVLIALLAGPELLSDNSKPPLVVFCAAGLREPVTAVARDYEAATGREVELRFGGSESLLNQLMLGASADVFIPADESYFELLDQSSRDRFGGFDDITPIARQRAVLVTRAGNPKNIHGWTDLFRSDVTLAQAQPDAAAIGRLTREHFRKDERWERLHRRTLTYLGTVTDVVNAVILGSVDAGIVWDALAVNNPQLHVVPAPELDDVEAIVKAGVLIRSQKQHSAREFLGLLTAPDCGQRHLREHGFRVGKER